MPIIAAICFVVLSLLSLTASANSTQREPKRLALIIANQDYVLPELHLDNPINDALTMNESLAQLGFENKLILNSNKHSFEQQLGVFIKETRAAISGGEQVVLLLYYAGHGIQYQGVNYLVPVESGLSAKPEVSGEDIKREFISLSRVSNRLATLNALTNIVILDACRDLPFYELAGEDVSGWTDLVKPNFFVAFGTAPGSKALDGTGTVNGLFTQAIVEHIHLPNQNLSQLFQNVRRQVMQSSSGYQIPQETNQATYDFYFVDSVASSISFWLLLAAAGSAIAILVLLKKVPWAQVSATEPKPILGRLFDDHTGELVAMLQSSPMTLGRGIKCDIKLADTATQVSRNHCQLTFDPVKKCVFLEESGTSTNGTYLENRHQPIATNRKVKLKSGDRFYLAAPEGESMAIGLRLELAGSTGGGQ